MTDAVQPNSQLASEVAEAEARAQVLLADPGLLRRYVEASRDLGLVGEERNVAILKLALVSRVLKRPVNLVVKGPSSAGKNFLVETALALEDRSAYMEITVASERFLGYVDTDLKHRFIYMPEAAGMGGWGPVGLSIMRSLIWGNRVSIGTVETKQGIQARRSEKEGPTGLIVTTTRALEREMETRMLALEVGDTPAQTRAVLRGIASGQDGSRASVDTEAWQALSRSISPIAVTIPFAPWLAERMPVQKVRARRDFTQMLTLIAASAILHREQRPKQGAEGVVATVVDYAIVHSLVGQWFAVASAGGLTPAEEEAVKAVKDLNSKPLLEPVTYTKVAKRLGLYVSAARRRLLGPVMMGVVVNNESQAHRPANLALGEAPERVPSLPEPEEVLAAFPHLDGEWVDPATGQEQSLG